LWKFIEETQKISSASQVASITKLSARVRYQKIRQCTEESIITYIKSNSIMCTRHIRIKETSPLMIKILPWIFLEGLDNVRYAAFKTKVMILLTTKTLM